MPYDWVHMAKMAKPKKVHPFYIPDRASVYWLDYLIDPTPHAMTDPQELKSYYENEAKKFPSAVRLSKPKFYEGGEPEIRSRTSRGSSTSSLCYSASNTFKELSKSSDDKLQKQLRTRPSSGYMLNSNSSPGSSIHLKRAESEFLGSRPRPRSRRGRDYQKADYRSPSPCTPRCKSAVIKDAEVSRFKEGHRPLGTYTKFDAPMIQKYKTTQEGEGCHQTYSHLRHRPSKYK